MAVPACESVATQGYAGVWKCYFFSTRLIFTANPSVSFTYICDLFMSIIKVLNNFARYENTYYEYTETTSSKRYIYNNIMVDRFTSHSVCWPNTTSLISAIPTFVGSPWGHRYSGVGGENNFWYFYLKKTKQNKKKKKNTPAKQIHKPHITQDDASWWRIFNATWVISLTSRTESLTLLITVNSTPIIDIAAAIIGAVDSCNRLYRQWLLTPSPDIKNKSRYCVFCSNRQPVWRNALNSKHFFYYLCFRCRNSWLH